MSVIFVCNMFPDRNKLNLLPLNNIAKQMGKTMDHKCQWFLYGTCSQTETNLTLADFKGFLLTYTAYTAAARQKVQTQDRTFCCVRPQSDISVQVQNSLGKYAEDQMAAEKRDGRQKAGRLAIYCIAMQSGYPNPTGYPYPTGVWWCEPIYLSQMKEFQIQNQCEGVAWLGEPIYAW